MSNWISTQGYDVAAIDRKACVMVKGGDYYADWITDPAWRIYATAADMDAARKIAGVLNDALDEVSPPDDLDEHGVPRLVREWLEEHDDGHLIEVANNGWTLRHSLLCRLGDLFACPINQAAQEQGERLAIEYGEGRYIVDLEDDLLIVVDRTVG